MRLMTVKPKLAVDCYISNCHFVIDTQQYLLSLCMYMPMYISTVFICIHGLASYIKLFKTSADYLKANVITYD